MTPLETLEMRHSVRSFSEERVPDEIIKKLKAEVVMTNSHEQGMRFQIITDDPAPLESFSHSYGTFRNPRNYLAAVVDTATPHAYERAGYFGERFAIKAVTLGLGTCFVSATYNPAKVRAQIRAGEKILFLILFGYRYEKNRLAANIVNKFSHIKKMMPDDFFQPKSDLDDAARIFPNLAAGLKAIACAPSAYNKRPVRLFANRDSGKPVLCAGVKDANPANLIDLGIAKYNFNYATDTLCEWGNGAPSEENFEIDATPPSSI